INLESGRRCRPRQPSQLSLSLRAWVFHPNTRGHVRLLGPCFKTGRLKPLRQHPTKAVLPPSHRIRQEAITHPKVPHSSRPCPMIESDAGPSTRKYTRRLNSGGRD
ncbi:hypothetical protein PENSPDRAFT_709319, partial [Peniophora sp. CONT]